MCVAGVCVAACVLQSDSLLHYSRPPGMVQCVCGTLHLALCCLIHMFDTVLSHSYVRHDAGFCVTHFLRHFASSTVCVVKCVLCVCCKVCVAVRLSRIRLLLLSSPAVLSCAGCRVSVAVCVLQCVFCCALQCVCRSVSALLRTHCGRHSAHTVEGRVCNAMCNRVMEARVKRHRDVRQEGDRGMFQDTRQLAHCACLPLVGSLK